VGGLASHPAQQLASMADMAVVPTVMVRSVLVAAAAEATAAETMVEGVVATTAWVETVGATEQGMLAWVTAAVVVVVTPVVWASWAAEAR